MAIVLNESGAPEALRPGTVPDPAAGPGQIVVQVAHCDVRFHDVVVRNGTLKAAIRMPLIQGREIAATIVTRGACASAFGGTSVTRGVASNRWRRER
jgi:NADPH:quinone reductase-like Zn-dependent oxidoreductase